MFVIIYILLSDLNVSDNAHIRLAIGNWKKTDETIQYLPRKKIISFWYLTF